MLTLIAHRFVVGGHLPQLSYLTLMDYFLLGSTFMVLLGFAGVVMTARLVGEDNRVLAKRVNKIFRWGYPLAFLRILFISL